MSSKIYCLRPPTVLAAPGTQAPAGSQVKDIIAGGGKARGKCVMPLLGFKKEFAPLVELGLQQPEHPEAKRQTIRALRKDGKDPKAGDTLYLYTGLRTKGCKKLGEAVCLSTTAILITEKHIFLGGRRLDAEEMADFAKADGFSSVDAFRAFFRDNHGLPFRGLLIKW